MLMNVVSNIDIYQIVVYTIYMNVYNKQYFCLLYAIYMFNISRSTYHNRGVSEQGDLRFVCQLPPNHGLALQCLFDEGNHPVLHQGSAIYLATGLFGTRSHFLGACL